MSNDYEIRAMSVMVNKTTEPSFSEMATTVRIEDESGGEFVEVEQEGRTDIGKIQITPEEWPMLREAIDRMIAECREAK